MGASVAECTAALETFLNAYTQAASLPTNGKDISIRIALAAVWMAGREYQRNITERQNLKKPEIVEGC